MVKTDLTKKVERALWEETHEKVHGCFEVKIGLPKTQAMLTGNEEFVDYITFSSYSGEFVCYEIKTSKSDIKSSAKLSFVGHRNYLVLPVELYEEVQEEKWFRDKIPYGIGIMCYYSALVDTVKIVKKCKRYELSVGAQALLMESITRSMARETNRYYKSSLADETVVLTKGDYQSLQTEFKSTKKQLNKTEHELSELKENFWPIMEFLLNHEIINEEELWDEKIVYNKLLEYLQVESEVEEKE